MFKDAVASLHCCRCLIALLPLHHCLHCLNASLPSLPSTHPFCLIAGQQPVQARPQHRRAVSKNTLVTLYTIPNAAHHPMTGRRADLQEPARTSPSGPFHIGVLSCARAVSIRVLELSPAKMLEVSPTHPPRPPRPQSTRQTVPGCPQSAWP